MTETTTSGWWHLKRGGRAHSNGWDWINYMCLILFHSIHFSHNEQSSPQQLPVVPTLTVRVLSWSATPFQLCLQTLKHDRLVSKSFNLFPRFLFSSMVTDGRNDWNLDFHHSNFACHVGADQCCFDFITTFLILGSFSCLMGSRVEVSLPWQRAVHVATFQWQSHHPPPSPEAKQYYQGGGMETV